MTFTVVEGILSQLFTAKYKSASNSEAAQLKLTKLTIGKYPPKVNQIIT